MKPLSQARRQLRIGTALATGLLALLHSQDGFAQTLPVGPTVASGTLTGGGVPVFTANDVTIDVAGGAGNNPVITWTSFDLGVGKSAIFTSPDTAIAHSVLNRVIGGATIFPSKIDGTINASNGGNNNIAVWLVNPAGITFSSTATYSGGSLILSTLEPGGLNAFPPSAGSTTFNVNGALTYDGSSTKSVTLNKSLSTQGSLLVIGQAVKVGNGVSLTASNGTVTLVAADKVTFPSGIGSPMSFTIDTGSALAGGVQIGSATISGQSVTVAAVTQAAALATALQVDSGATLTATAAAGGVTLATKSVGTVAVTTANANDSINMASGSGAGTGLIASGAGGAIKVASSGPVTLDGNVTATNGAGTFTLEGSTIALNGGTTSTGGNQTYTGPVTLGTDTTLTSTSGLVKFTSTVDSGAPARTLTITGNAQFDGAVGATELKSLSVSGTTAINGGSVATKKDQTYTGAVTLGANTTLDSSATNGDILLGAVTGGTKNLSVITGNGNQTFNGLDNIGTLTLTGAGTRTVNAGTYKWATLTGGTLGKVTTNGAIVLGQATDFGTTTLGSDTTISGSPANFTSTVDATTSGGQALTVPNVTFADAVGGSKALKSLNVTGTSALNGGTVTTNGNQTYTGAVTLSVNTTLDSSAGNGTIALGPVTGATKNLSVITGIGGQTFNGLDNIGTLTLNGTGTRTVNAGTYKWATLTGGTLGAVTTNGAIVLNQATNFGATTLGSDTTISGSTPTFTSTVDATSAGGQGLALTGNGIFTGAVGGTTALKSLSVTGTSTLPGVVKTTGTQTYTGLATLTGPTTLTGSTVSFGSALDGAVTLSIVGNASFGSTVGSTTPLSSISVSGTSAINGGLVKTTGNQTYTGAVTLGTNTTLDSSTGNGDIALGAVTGGTNNLSVTTGTGKQTFNGLDNIGTLTLTGAGTRTVNAGNYKWTTLTGGTLGNVTTNGTLVLGQATTFGAVNLGSNTTLNSSAVNGAITLGTVTGNSKDFSVLTGTGAQTFNGLVNVGALTLTGTGTRTLNAGTYSWASLTGGTLGAVTTNGTLTLGQATNFGAVTLGSTTTLDSSAANGALSLGAVTGGGFNLSVLTGTGAQTFNGLDNIGTLTLTGTGTRTVNAGNYKWTTLTGGTLGNVTANGTLILGQPTTFGTINLGSNTTLDSSAANGALTLGAVTGNAKDFTVTTGTGAQTFNGLANIGTLTLTGTGTRTINAGTYSWAAPIPGALGPVTTNGAIVLGQTTNFGATILGSDTAISGAAVNFTSTVDATVAGAQKLDVNNAGFDTTFGGAVGTVALKSLSIDGTTKLNAGTVKTTGDQTYTGAVILGADTALTSGGLVKFGSTVDSDGTARSLTVNGNANFVGNAGGTAALAAVQVAAPATIASTGNITATGQIKLDAATSIAVTGLTTTAATSDISVNQGGGPVGTVAITSGVSAGQNLVVKGTAVDLAAGAATPVSQTATGKVDITATTGNITGSDKLTLTSNSGNTSVADSNALVLDAGAGTINFALGSNLNAGNAPVGLRYANLASVTLGNVTAAKFATVDATHTVFSNSPMGANLKDLKAGKIKTTSPLSIQVSGTVDLVSATSTGGSVTLKGDSVKVGNGDPLSLSSATQFSMTSSATGSITLAGKIDSTGGTQTYTGPVVLSADTTMVGSTMTFSSATTTINGAFAVDVQGNGVFDGAIGNTTALKQLHVLGTSDINGGKVNTTLTQVYDGAVKLGADTTMSATSVSFKSTLDGAKTLDIIGNATFGDLVGSDPVGGTTPLTSLSVSGTSVINGGSVKTSGNQTYTDAVTLGANTTLTSATGTANFGSTVRGAADGAQSLTIAGDAVFGGAVGDGGKRLTSLSVSRTSAINGKTVTTTGSQTYSGATTLGDNSTLTGTAISFGSTLDGAKTLDIIGNATFGDLVGSDPVGGTTPLTSLTVSGTSVINGGAVKTSGNQTYSGAVKLGADTTLTSATGTANFGSTVRGAADGAQSLTIAGDAVFGGAVGDGGKRLTSLSVSRTSAINGKTVTTTGSQTYSGATTLGDNSTLTGTAISFGSTLDGAKTLDIIGNATFGDLVGSDPVGGTTPLTSLTVSGTSVINGGAVKTSGDQTYTGGVTLGANTTLTSATGAAKFGSTVRGAADAAQSLDISGNAVFGGAVGDNNQRLTTLSVTGTSAINGKTVNTSGNQTYTGPATLGADTTLTSGGLVSFGNTLDSFGSQRALTIAGNASFAGAVGSILQLTSLTVNGTTNQNVVTVTTSGAQLYNGAATMIADATLTGTTITFASTLNGANALKIAGNAIFNGAVGGATPLSSLLVTGTSAINGGLVNTTGTQQYNGAATLGADTTMSASAVTFGSTLDGAKSLGITGNATFGGAVGGSAALTSLSVSGTSAINGGLVKTTGAQSYKGAATLGADTKLIGTTIGFGATLDGSKVLEITGDASFGGAVGSSAPLTSLSVSGTSDINGGSVKTTATQTYTGAVKLGADTALTGTAVTFGSKVNSDATARSLTVNGNSTFGGAVGDTSALNNLLVTGTSAINGGSVKTNGTQTYQGAATLGAEPTVLSGTTVSFGNTLDSSGSPRSLTINGNASLGGAVGGNLKLNSLKISGTTAINGGAVNTVGAQTYTGAVTLGQDAALAGTAIAFGSTVDGANKLAITGDASFAGSVGSGTQLKSVAVSGKSAINGKSVSTSGDQTYTGAATLGADTVMTSKSGTVAFGSTLDSDATATPRSLAIAGNAKLGGAVGGTAKLSTLSVSGTSALNGKTIATTGDQSFTGAATLGADTVLTSGGAAEFKSTVDSDGTPRSLAITTVGNAKFGDKIGAVSALKDLTVNAPGTITATSINTTGLVDLKGGGAVQLASVAASGPVSASGTTVTVSGATSSGGAVTLKATTGDLQLGAVTAGGDTSLSAKTKATLAAVTATGKNVTLSAADAELGGTVTGAKITIADNGGAGNLIRLGDNPAGSGGFQLNVAELNNLAAADVILDAGTSTGQTRQDVAIGTLNLTNSAVKNFSVYALQRLDLTGNLTSSALQSLQLGGTATAADMGTVMRIAAQADGTGGLIKIGTAKLDLRSASIGVGLDTGFLAALGVAPGSTATQQAALMISNPGSSLYNSLVTGGAAYLPSGQQLITAGSMTVRYSNFALFQNTGLLGTNSGVTLASTSSPATPALSLFGPNPPVAGPFGLFGQINGVTNTPAALLGPSVIVVSAIDRASARINGCLVGSGAGCLTSSSLPTSLINILPARTTIIFANADFEVPFDPLVATNNDTLFGDVGTFGLDDIVDLPIECPAGDKSGCSAENKGAPK